MKQELLSILVSLIYSAGLSGETVPRGDFPACQSTGNVLEMHGSTISSVSNPQVKLVRALGNATACREHGLFLLEGESLVRQAWSEGWPIEESFVTPEWLARHDCLGQRFAVVTDRVMSAMTTLDTPPGILAIAKMPAAAELPPVGPRSIWLICDRLQDPGNLGTVIRTADAAGVEAIVLGPGCAYPYGPKAVRASMGSIMHVRAMPVHSLETARAVSRAAGMRWIAMAPRAGESLFEADLSGPIAWWLGNEAAGLPNESLAAADLVVEIPLPGRAESLNAAAATAVCLFETVRQRLSMPASDNPKIAPGNSPFLGYEKPR